MRWFAGKPLSWHSLPLLQTMRRSALEWAPKPKCNGQLIVAAQPGADANRLHLRDAVRCGQVNARPDGVAIYSGCPSLMLRILAIEMARRI